MGLNLQGLGFSFAAKDQGLEKQQEKYSKGFETMADKMSGVSAAAANSDVGDIASSGDTEKINQAAESFDNLSASTGHWSEQSRDASGRFQRDANQVESGQRKIGGGFNFISGAMANLNQLVSQSKFQTFIQSISLAKLNGISDALTGIASSGTNLTTGLEAEMHALGKTTRATGANFGYTGKELKKFSSKAAGMAKGLAIDAGTSATSLRAWNEAGSELGAMGFKSARDVAKFSEAFGVNADILRNSGKQMRNEFKFSDKEINQVIGSFTMMGQLTGDVGAALNSLPEIMGQIRRNAALMGTELDSKELAKYASGTAALAAGLMQQGQSSDKARSNAIALSETMLSSKENFQDLFSGTATELSQFKTSLGVAFGDIGVGFEAMNQGPQEFMAGLTEMVQFAKKTGGLTGEQVKMLGSQLRTVFGKDQAAEMVNFFQSADEATLEMMKTVSKAPADLGKLAKAAFVSSKTLADRFEEAEQRMVKSFRSINKKGARQFVSDSNKQFKSFGEGLKTLAGSGGLMGSFVNKMSLAHQIGAKAFLPKTLRPMAALMGGVVSEMAPLAGVMKSFGVSMKDLANPFVIVTAAATGFYALNKSNQAGILKENKSYGKQEKALVKLNKQLARKKEGDKRRPAIVAKIAAVEASLSKIRSKAAKEAQKQTIVQVEKGVREAIVKITQIGEVIVQEAKKWFPAIKEFLTVFWNTLIYGVDPNGGGSTFASEMGAKLGDAIRTAASVAWDFVVDYLNTWWKGILTIWSSDATSFTEKIKATFASSAGVIIGAFALAKFTPVFSILGKLIGLLGGVLVKAAGKAAKAVGKKLGSALSEMAGNIWEKALPRLKAFKNSLIGATKAVAKFAVKLLIQGIKAVGRFAVSIIATVIPALITMAGAFITTAVPAIISFGIALSTALWPFTLIAAAVAAVVFLAYTIYDNWGAISDWFGDLWEGIVSLMTTLWGPVKKILMAPIEAVEYAWGFITGIFTDPIGTIKKAWSDLAGFFTGLWDDVTKGAEKAWKASKKFAGDAKDAVFGKKVDYSSREKQRLHGMKNLMKKQLGLSAEQAQKMLAQVDKTNILKKVSHHRLKDALLITNNNLEEAIRLTKDKTEFKTAQAQYKATRVVEAEAARRKAIEIKASTDVTTVVGEETIKQVTATLGGVDAIAKGVATKTAEIENSVKTKTSGIFSFLNLDINAFLGRAASFMEKGLAAVNKAAEENAPSKGVIIGEKSLAKIGPQATKAFGAAGKAMDTFGGDFLHLFEGKRSVEVVTKKAFDQILNNARSLRLALVTTFKDMWVEALERTALAISAITKDTKMVVGQLKALAQASQALTSARMDDRGIKAEGGAPPKTTKTFRQTNVQEQIYDAIHHPEWFYNDYMPQVVIMNTQLAAIAAGMSGTALGGRLATVDAARISGIGGERGRKMVGETLQGTMGPSRGGPT